MFVPKDNVADVESGGAALFTGGRVLAQSHGKKEGHDGQVGGGGLGGEVTDGLASTAEAVHSTEELGCEGLLAMWWRVQVGEGI